MATKKLYTSHDQTLMILEYMRVHGDIGKINTKVAEGQLKAKKKWEELTSMLNSCASGDPRDSLKWRKVWVDMKSSAKTRASKNRISATGTGGGPSTSKPLSITDEAVLSIMNPQSAYGMEGVMEAGLLQVEFVESHIVGGDELPSGITDVVVVDDEDGNEMEAAANAANAALQQLTPTSSGGHGKFELFDSRKRPSTSKQVSSGGPKRTMLDRVTEAAAVAQQMLTTPVNTFSRKKGDDHAATIVEIERAKLDLKKEEINIRKQELELKKRCAETELQFVSKLNDVIEAMKANNALLTQLLSK